MTQENTRQKRRSKHECLRCDGLVYTKYACAAAPRPRTCSVFFWCFAVLKLRFFVPARTKLQSILSYSQDFGRRRGEKDCFKTVCFLMSAGLLDCLLFVIILPKINIEFEKIYIIIYDVKH